MKRIQIFTQKGRGGSMRYQLNMALGLVPAIALAANTSFSQAMVGRY
jgi:hypothetical protein